MVLLTVVSIYLVVDFFERIDNFISSHLGFVKAGAFFLYNIPMIVSQILPICLLLSVLIALGLMNKHNEIVAFKSSGISNTLLLKPVLLLGVGFTLILFVLSEIVVPLTVPKSNKIWLEDVKKKQMVTTREKNIWIKGDRSITHIKFYDPNKKMIFGLSLYCFDEQFNLIKRIDAEKGVFDNGNWHLYHIMEQDRMEKDHIYKTRVYDEQIKPLELVPEDLQQVRTKSEEMGFMQLYAYIQEVEAEGYDALNFRVDFFAKTAFPFVCIIMCLLGTGIAVRRNMREGLPVGIAYGLGIAFLYWVFYNFCLSLGYGGLIPPVISAWMANLVFLCWGVFVLLNPE